MRIQQRAFVGSVQFCHMGESFLLLWQHVFLVSGCQNWTKLAKKVLLELAEYINIESQTMP